MSLPDNGFTFKQFFVAHDRCAMKVNTDAIILGAWAGVDKAQRILDVGTGSGVIALMLAQRSLSSAVIDAVELEPNAFSQAKNNFENSLWPGRINAVNQNIIDYAGEATVRYDVIVSNPPYFDNGVDCHCTARNQARYTETLTHAQLLASCRKLLAPQGLLYLVLPCTIAAKFLRQAEENGWFCGQKLFVRDTELKPSHLLLFEMAPYPLDAKENTLTIRQINRQYTHEFRCLTKDFYLFF